MSEKSDQVLAAVKKSLAELPFNPTAADFTEAIGQLLIDSGTQLLKINNPGLEPHNLQLVERDYIMCPTYATALILQGHIMRGTWAETLAKENKPCIMDS